MREGGDVTLQVLGSVASIDRERGAVEVTGARAPTQLAVCVLHYLSANLPNGSPPAAGQLVSFNDIPAMRGYYAPYSGRVLGRVTRRFGAEAVNLERAMRADGRFDGHIVQGHVDEAGRVEKLTRHGNDVQLFIATTPGFSGLLVEKGSVTIDGVSLTVVGVEASGGFDVALIPHTLEVTTLGRLRPGAPVNLEADVLGKYVKRYLERVTADAAIA